MIDEKENNTIKHKEEMKRRVTADKKDGDSISQKL